MEVQQSQPRQCSKCVLDQNDDPEMTFDQQGVCNYCSYYDDLRAQVLLKEPARSNKLNQIVQQLKQDGKGKEYDCIIGISGGVDSTYLAYFVKQLGLRPLAVHLDYGWNSELAVKNIESILQRLGISLYTYVVDWEEIKDLQQAFLRASVVDIELINDFAIAACLFNAAVKFKIKHVIHGWNVATEGGKLPNGWTWSKYDQMNILGIHRKFGKKKLRTYPRLSAWKKLYLERSGKVNMFGILNYTDFDRNTVKDLLVNQLEWRDYGGKHFESIFTRFYQGYILPKKFGIDKRKFHLSVLVCSGQLTRQQAMAELDEAYYPDEIMKADREFVLKKLDISEEEFVSIMQQPRVPHAAYGSYHDKVYPRITRALVFLSKIKKWIKW